MMINLLATIAVFITGQVVQGFYLPGVNPHSFFEGDPVKLKVNKLTSIKDELPVDYYKLPFCRPLEGIKKEHENLGELLSGDKIENSPYKIRMKEDMYCEQLCYVDMKDTKKLRKYIKEEYHNNWIVDNLPSASKVNTEGGSFTYFSHGFPIGYFHESKDEYFINNHVNIYLEYHKVDTSGITGSNSEDEYRIVRFTVEPLSINHEFTPKTTINDDDNARDGDDSSKSLRIADINNPIASCVADNKSTHTDINALGKGYKPQLLSEHGTGPVLFTYDVIWTENKEVVWASRWDIYLTNSIPNQVQWYSITNSLLTLLVLSILLAMVLMKNLRGDFERYSKLFDEENEQENDESGWKLVHADIFRAPAYPMVLAICCGSGLQILAMAIFTLGFAVMGFLNPSRRGSLVMALLSLYVLMGTVAGYTSARFYKSFNGKRYQRNTIATAIAFPSVFFAVFFIMNLMAVAKESGDAVPLLRMIELLTIWFGLSTPLVFVGSLVGYKVDSFEYPVNVSSIPRQVPDQPMYLQPITTALCGGFLQFGVIFMQLFFIFGSLWMDQYFYVFGFLCLTFIILIATVAEITIILNYYQLCSENYHWWWRSFFNGGAIAIYVYGYAFKYFSELETNCIATYILYFGYMGLVSVALCLAMGSVGTLSCLWFNKKIFGAIKID